MATTALCVGSERSRNGFCSTLRGSLFGLLWKVPLSSASHLLRRGAKAVTEGAFAQRCALSQRAPERLRCVVTRKNNSFKTEGEVTIRGESSFFSCWLWVECLWKCFHALEKLVFYFLKQSRMCWNNCKYALNSVFSKTSDETAKGAAYFCPPSLFPVFF